MVRRRVHDGREFAAVIARRMAPALHALDNPDILGEYGPPHLGVGGAHGGEFLAAHGLVGIIDLNLLMRPARTVRQQQNGEGVIVMNAKKNIREQRDIFGPGIPFA